MRPPRLCTVILAALLLPLALSACDAGNGHDKVMGSVDVAAGASVTDAATVNGSVNIEAGARARDARTVNGAVNIGANAEVQDATTVNGSIGLADNARAKTLTTVNGSITLATGAQATGSATTVNGRISLAAGSAVAGTVTTVNGRITVDAAQVGKGLVTANGDIDVTGNAVVEGGIKVTKSHGGGFLGIHFGSSNGEPRITIGAGATVDGPLTFERPVKLFISDAAHVAGPITGAQAIKFQGAAPPAS